MIDLQFTPSGVCSKQIDMKITPDNKIESVNFTGGCPGNLIGISKLVEGMEITKVIELLKDTKCGNKSTSCPDQLTKALKEVLDNKKSA